MRHRQSRTIHAVALASALLLPLARASAQTTPFHSFSALVPSDAKATCTVAPATFATWFSGGAVALNGTVSEADSVNFSDVPNCDFYIWSERMFLWLTSPGYAGRRTFQSQLFYDVSPEVSGARTLLPHPTGTNNVLLPAQASGEVLQAQTGSLVYYSRQVNDVLAYFRGLAPNANNPTSVFPTTLNDLLAIEAFAGKTFEDRLALAVEVKSSWVEASTLARPNSYITMYAHIPAYNQTSNTLWTRTGTKHVRMAMVGMHVVGSTKGHPEMIWATFEHLDNAPNAQFGYRNAGNAIIDVLAANPTGPNWLFSSNTAVPGTFNDQRMDYFADPDIEATLSHTIGPSDTMRMKVWGAFTDVRPNPLVSNTADSNSQIISINNSINGMMQAGAAGDVRNNYFMTGSTWTIFGNPPNGQNPFGGNEVGTSSLANPTMETYDQGAGTDSASLGQNCFACHSAGFPGGSRVFDALSQVTPPVPPKVQIPALSTAVLIALAVILMFVSVMLLRTRMRSGDSHPGPA